MSLAWISVGALVIAVTLSCTTTINVGVLSLAFALIVGVLLGDMSTAAVLDGFPVDLFVTLVGVTLLFAIAEVNGTLARVTERAVRAVPRPCRCAADHVLRRSASSSQRSAREPRPQARCSRHPRWPSRRAPASRRS